MLTSAADTAISQDLKKALQTYPGPTVKINSLRRNQKGSHHHTGDAVDFAWCPQVIAFLLSSEGQCWLNEHKLNMYIEGKPGSTRVRKYFVEKDSSKYVFFNPKATGDHIHIYVDSKSPHG